ncbi:methyl-accepting chemotaxis protein [Nitrincola iocasae]|uniref:Methyl-accepting chemotaxis protein n=1 Tax=Nitrincola iocasae TaxID=2614693 RepID=A0A5J6LA36_9GAMM|nr:PAS domain-containing methyl-accepting chemotaxis protein [Nitrincola iocasae]QEW05393.1 methyl-accepting chemotaxis protein [Nitrincola iocasae]
MKKNLPVTDTEHLLNEEDMIVTLTDPKGIITFANEAFIRISGFSKEELIGTSHNLVRHPDMPEAAFKDMWDTLKSGQSWMGLVKNRCKNGDFYWVSAFVSPCHDNNRLVGYQSVRFRPTRAAVKRAEHLYRQLRLGRKPRLMHRLDPRNLGTTVRLMVALSFAFSLQWLYAWFVFELPKTGAFLSAMGAIILTPLLAWLFSGKNRLIAARAKKVVDKPLMTLAYMGSLDESALVAHEALFNKAKISTVASRIHEISRDSELIFSQMNSAVDQTLKGVDQQLDKSQVVANAMQSLSATLRDVARNTGNASAAAQQTEISTRKGKQVLQGSVLAMESLAAEVTRASDVIHRLEGDVTSINHILDVISGIAEQTNLLALNASIEAARAGDQGRGFAVVADEVRSLASRTQQATQEIQQMIEQLQTGSKEAVKVMSRSEQKAREGVDQVSLADKALDEIAESSQIISTMNRQVAGAADEQLSVAEDVNAHIQHLAELGRSNADIALDLRKQGDELHAFSHSINITAEQLQR